MRDSLSEEIHMALLPYTLLYLYIRHSAAVIAQPSSAVGSLLYVRPPQDRLSIRIFGISVAFHPFGVAKLRLLFGIFVINKRLKCSLSDVSEIIRINPNQSERFYPKPSAMFLSIDKRYKKRAIPLGYCPL